MDTLIPEPKVSKFLFADTRIAWLWLLVRGYVGWQWLEAGLAKFNVDVWIGAKKGVAIEGFMKGALERTLGAHPGVSSWCASFLNSFALHHPVFFS